MRKLRKVLFVQMLLAVACIAAYGQWVKQSVDTTASFRGLSVVNKNVIWASGTGGTVIRTTDGGKTWKVITVPGAEKLDFRDIEAFDAKTAYILSIGSGGNSRIYKTTDGGLTWKLQFKNTNEKAFFDAIACWDRNNCIAMSDPVDGKFVLINTSDGGANWKPVDTAKMPSARDGATAFAASGTCLMTYGKSDVLLVSGGNEARVFRSADRAKTWSVSDSPIVKGTPGSGIFSIALWNVHDATNGVIVGGNYEKPSEAAGNLAFSDDLGTTWISAKGLTGYRSGVVFVDGMTIVAVGSSGSDITRDGGKTWRNIDKASYNAVQAKGKRAVWAVGEKGMVAKMK